MTQMIAITPTQELYLPIISDLWSVYLNVLYCRGELPA